VRSAFTANVGRDFSLGLLNQLAVGARTEARVKATPGVSSVMPEISMLGLMGKARFALFRVPPRYAPKGRSQIRATISLADVNGLLYWGMR
jgi:hypothetical protein